MRMTIKHLQQLEQDRKIRGYKFPKPGKKFHGTPKKLPFQKRKSEAISWLEWNLMYWSNGKSIVMETEYQFDEKRRWRFDFAFPALKIAVEYEGGIFMAKGGHNSTAGMDRDIKKYTRAQVLRWQVIRVSAINYQTVLQTLNELVK